jgi:hypothetical protein
MRFDLDQAKEKDPFFISLFAISGSSVIKFFFVKIRLTDKLERLPE